MSPAQTPHSGLHPAAKAPQNQASQAAVQCIMTDAKRCVTQSHNTPPMRGKAAQWPPKKKYLRYEKAEPDAGLLEGAHTGHGLGHEFLRHIQRCRMLVHVLDGTSPDAIGDFRAIQTELQLFNPEIATKPQVGLCCVELTMQTLRLVSPDIAAQMGQACSPLS